MVTAKHVIQRIKLPPEIWTRLRREARRRHCSISALVAAVVRRDLEDRRIRLRKGGEAA
jgi:predicted DNA-binding ribbon-helix-helix protein